MLKFSNKPVKTPIFVTGSDLRTSGHAKTKAIVVLCGSGRCRTFNRRLINWTRTLTVHSNKTLHQESLQNRCQVNNATSHTSGLLASGLTSTQCKATVHSYSIANDGSAACTYLGPVTHHPSNVWSAAPLFSIKPSPSLSCFMLSFITICLTIHEALAALCICYRADFFKHMTAWDDNQKL